MNILSVKILASLIALFGLGAGSGYLVAKRTTPPPLPPAQVAVVPPGLHTNLENRFFSRWSDRSIAEYRQLLNLTPAQESALRARYDLLAGEYNALQAEIRPRIAQALVRARTDMARDLTPAQRRLFWQHLRQKAKETE
jgi:hypothetical protein